MPRACFGAKRCNCAIEAKSGIIVGEDVSVDSGELESDEEEEDGAGAGTEEVGDDADLEQMEVPRAEAEGADGDTQPEDAAPLQLAKEEAKRKQKAKRKTDKGGKGDTTEGSDDVGKTLAAVQQFGESQAEGDDRREKQRDKRNMKMFVGLVAAMSSNNKNARSNNCGVLDDSSGSAKSDLGSVASADSPPTERVRTVKRRSLPRSGKAVNGHQSNSQVRLCVSVHHIFFVQWAESSRQAKEMQPLLSSQSLLQTQPDQCLWKIR